MHQMSHSQEKQKTSFETQPLNVSDISIQKATEVVPATLQQFLRWLLQSQRAFEREGHAANRKPQRFE